MSNNPAQFMPGPNGTYLPANRVAADFARTRNRMTLDVADLAELKGKGVRVTLMNGEPIVTEVMA